MLNIQKQINYWITGAEDDIETAGLLIREKRTLHGLFFCHLVIEKAIKAHVGKKIGEVVEVEFNGAMRMFEVVAIKHRSPIGEPVKIDPSQNRTVGEQP